MSYEQHQWAIVCLELSQPLAFGIGPVRRRVTGRAVDDGHAIGMTIVAATLLPSFVDNRLSWAFARRAARDDIDITQIVVCISDIGVNLPPVLASQTLSCPNPM